MEHGQVGIMGEGSAYRDTKVPEKLMGPLRSSLRVNLLPGEELLGLFAVWRLRRPVTTLVVTDQRLLTLGEVDKGLPVVDEVDRAAVTELHVEKQKIFSSGRIVAETQLGPVGLGTLELANDGSTFLGLDEVLARRPSGPGMPLIPVPGGAPVQGAASPTEDRPPIEDRVRQGHDPGGTVSGGGGSGHRTGGAAHPLIAHLTALADLRERGALTDEEFTRAKARLLADPGGESG